MIKLKKSIFLFFLFLFALLLSASAQKQKMYVFDFNNTLSDTNNQRTPLIELEKPGYFVNDTIKELGGFVKTVYRFGLNSGLAFDNADAGNPIREGYSVELFFKLDMYNAWKRVLDFKSRKSDTGPYIYLRKVSFYKYGSADMNPIKPGTYVHYVLSRDSASKIVNIFVDGTPVYQFKDSLNLATLDYHNKLHLFHDNMSMGNEASAGNIAMIKIYDHVITKELISENFKNLVPTFEIFAKRPLPPKPKPQVILKGNIVDKRNGAPIIANVTVERENDNAFINTIANEANSGDYLIKLRAGTKYYVTVSAKGFMSFADMVDFSNEDGTKPVIKDFELARIEIGKSVTLNRIIFKQGSPELLPTSYEELDKLVSMMKENSKLEIEIHGHTDNQGNAKLNVVLSEERVKSVKDYLVKNGIDKKRISGKGFGGSKPIASNVAEHTRKLNRRVEFLIKKF